MTKRTPGPSTEPKLSVEWIYPLVSDIITSLQIRREEVLPGFKKGRSTLTTSPAIISCIQLYSRSARAKCISGFYPSSARAIRKTALRAYRGFATVLLMCRRSAHTFVCLKDHASMSFFTAQCMAELLITYDRGMFLRLRQAAALLSGR